MMLGWFNRKKNIALQRIFTKEVIFFIFIYAVLLVSASHNSYPDEMDNILGGYFINHGVFPYTGFFTHHGPLTYYLASFLTFFSGQSFVRFRLVSTLFYLLLLVGTYTLFKKRIKAVNTNFYLLYIAVFKNILQIH